MELVRLLGAARTVVALTGAGVSAESGVPTFREAQTGLWAQYRAEDLATPQAFKRDPRRVWEWYAWRREIIAGVQPNPGHFALAQMEAHLAQGGASFTLITQNVDGLHHRAGSRKVIELHGSIARTRCAAENRVVEAWQDTGETPPRCPYCGGLLRPDVVWFGEILPPAALQAALEAVRACEVCFSIGTSGLVQPAASLPFMALEQGAVVVEINPQDTPLTPAAGFVLAGTSGAVLPDLVGAVWPPGAAGGCPAA